MKLSIPPVSAQELKGSSAPIQPQPSGGFLQQLEMLSQKVQGFDGQILNGKAISPQELIAFQVKAHRYALGVELCAKTAEGIAATVRRFHSNQ